MLSNFNLLVVFLNHPSGHPVKRVEPESTIHISHLAMQASFPHLHTTVPPTYSLGLQLILTLIARLYYFQILNRLEPGLNWGPKHRHGIPWYKSPALMFELFTTEFKYEHRCCIALWIWYGPN